MPRARGRRFADGLALEPSIDWAWGLDMVVQDAPHGLDYQGTTLSLYRLTRTLTYRLALQ